MSFKEVIGTALRRAVAQLTAYLWFMVPLALLSILTWVYLTKKAHGVVDGPGLLLNEYNKDAILKRVDLMAAELQTYLVFLAGMTAAALAKVFRDPEGYRRSWLHALVVLCLGFGFCSGFFTWMVAQHELHTGLQHAIEGVGVIIYPDHVQIFRDWMQGTLAMVALAAMFLLGIPVSVGAAEEGK